MLTLLTLLACFNSEASDLRVAPSEHTQEEDTAGARAAPLTTDPLTVDDDGDGYTEEQGDCDDEDATDYPGAVVGVEA